MAIGTTYDPVYGGDMTRYLTTITAAILAITMLTPTAQADTDIDQFIDCTDSFWSIACGLEPPPYVEPPPKPADPYPGLDVPDKVFVDDTGNIEVECWDDGRVPECLIRVRRPDGKFEGPVV